MLRCFSQTGSYRHACALAISILQRGQPPFLEIYAMVTECPSLVRSPPADTTIRFVGFADTRRHFLDAHTDLRLPRPS